MKTFKDIAKREVNLVQVGKYKDKSWYDIAVLDPNYLLWSVANTDNAVPYACVKLALQATMFKKADKPKHCYFPMEDVPF